MRYNTGADRMPLPPDKQSLPRLVSIDAYRGFVMLLLLGEALRLREVARALPESRLWQWLAHHQTHATWSGCSLHDLIQPSFLSSSEWHFPFPSRRNMPVPSPVENHRP
ncbi:MAG: hypothetical protein R3F31_03535 [Verrucomicrobiales bacterium]